jgi:hypothetical protein
VWYESDFRAALTAAGINDYVRPFHDTRHGETPIALMTRVGHRSMQATKASLRQSGARR